MSQECLFYDSYPEALRDDISALGGPKVVGQWFWPEKGVEAARGSVNDRLNPDRRERFSDEQEQLIMRRAREARGFSAALFFLCDAIGVERPKPIEPRDEMAALQREFIASVRHLEALGGRIEKLTQPPLQAVQGGK